MGTMAMKIAGSKAEQRARSARVGVRAAMTVMLASVLGGCYTTRDVTETIPNDYKLRHPISLQ